MLVSANINTPQYWDEVYRRECKSGQAHSEHYHRDYGPIHDAIVRLVPAGSEVLDIACGAGVLCRKIGRQVPASRVTGVDFSGCIVERNRELDKELGIDYRCLDIRHSLGTIARRFDVVTMCEILEHLEEPEKVVASALSLLRPEGLFVLTCPHDNGIPDPEHVRCWGHDELFHLLARYSDTISFVHFPPPWFHVWMMAYLTKRQSGPEPGENP